jgi:hypothetical protein
MTNYYKAQFNGKGTAGRTFYPGGLAFNPSGDVFIDDLEFGLVDEFGPITSTEPAPLKECSQLPEDRCEFKKGSEEIHSEGITVNAAGDLFAAEYGSKVVYEFAPDGSLLREINGDKTKKGETLKEGTPEGFTPTAAAVNSSGDLYVADYEHGVVDEFAPSAFEASSTGAPVKEFTIAEPAYLAVAPTSGDLYVTGYASGGIHEFEPDGSPVEFNGGEEVEQNSQYRPKGEPFTPGAVAVAPSGEVYVGDGANGVVDRFSSTGAYLSQFNGKFELEGVEQTSFYPRALAVNSGGEVYVGDAEHERVDIFGAPEEERVEGQWVTEAATSIAATSATLNGTVNPEGGPVASCEFEYGTTSSYGQKASCEEPATSEIGEGTSTVEVHAKVSSLEPGTKYYFRVTGTGVEGAGGGGERSFTTHFKPASARIAAVTALTAHSATFNGDVNPEGSEGSYHFEYSTDGVTWTALESKSAGGSSGEVPVTETVNGLSGSSTYHVRLIAVNSEGAEARSGEETFPTPASAPQISGTGATVIDGTEATLYATIAPEKQATTYRFEYGTTTAYGTTVPVGEGNAGSTLTQVSETLTGLTPLTTYHFRVVATNATNTSYGADGSFTTAQTAGEGESPPAGSCPNETLRAESNLDPLTGVPYSAQLPDCRAYEQVTPPFKSFNTVITRSKETATASTAAISTAGSQVLEDSVPLLGQAGADEEITGTFYDLERTAAGWEASSLTAAASVFPFSQEELASAENVREGLWSAATPAQPERAEDFYRRLADGNFVNVGPIVPPSATAGPPHGADGKPAIASQLDGTVGASSDLSVFAFQLDSPFNGESSLLWPGDDTANGGRPSLYEYVGSGHSGEGMDIPQLVGIDNTGKQISQCGTGLGANVSKEDIPVHDGVSEAGATVFFTAQASGCEAGATGPLANQVYARVGLPSASGTTVNVAAASQSSCETATSCNVTSAITFQGATTDGSKVFFTSTQPLLASDKDTTNDIYECELPGDDGTPPPPVGLVDACPDLQAVSVTGTSSGAEVQSVVAVSEEGSRVYFTATGVLTATANSQGHTAQAGEDNLYVWEAAGHGGSPGHTAFIATLPGPGPKEAQATPDGRYLVFTTTADLTSGDTSTAAQAFRYDAQTSELVRVSVGFENGGNTNSDPVVLAPRLTERSTVSNNGAYIVFQSDDALTPQVHGGRQNVYEWHDGDVYLISDGTDSGEGAGLIGMDASGANIFFVTADKLVGQDTDEDYDVYDARIDGGFPKPTPEASCSGEVCQGPLSSSTTASSPLISSAGLPAIGNLAPPKAKPAAPPAKPLTRAQKLSKALKTCKRDKRKAKREKCEKEAKKNFGPVSKKAKENDKKKR